MLFLSTTVNRIDKKGRVSVPAAFRAILAKEESGGIYASASIRLGCIEGCGPAYFKKLHQRIEAMDPFSAERDALSNVLFGESVQLAFDAEGRVLLPPQLIEYAKLKDEAAFVGKGEFFEIWEPKAYAKQREQARGLVQKTFYRKAKS